MKLSEQQQEILRTIPKESHATPKSFSKEPRQRQRIYLPLRTLLILLTISLGLGSVIAYTYGKSQVTQSENSADENTSVIKNVGKHILLPKDVEPKVGKMVNIEQFKDDPFLSQAVVGDYVLFYPYQGRTLKAILWRPSEGKIVDVSLVALPAPGSI